MPIFDNSLSEHTHKDDVLSSELLGFSLFQDLEKNNKNLESNNAHLKKLADSCRRIQVTFDSRQISTTNCFFIIESGSFIIKCLSEQNVKIHDTEIEGQKTFFFTLRSRKHETIGDFIISPPNFADNFNNNIIILAIEEGSVIRVPKKDFIEFAKEYPLVYRNLYFFTIGKIKSLRDYIEAIQLNSDALSSCLAKMILFLANELGLDDDGKIKGFITKDYLKSLISEKSDKSINQKLENLKLMRLIDFRFSSHKKEEKSIKIIDKRGLEEVARNNTEEHWKELNNKLKEKIKKRSKSSKSSN